MFCLSEFPECWSEQYDSGFLLCWISTWFLCVFDFSNMLLISNFCCHTWCWHRILSSCQYFSGELYALLSRVHCVQRGKLFPVRDSCVVVNGTTLWSRREGKGRQGWEMQQNQLYFVNSFTLTGKGNQNTVKPLNQKSVSCTLLLAHVHTEGGKSYALSMLSLSLHTWWTKTVGNL